MFQKLQKRTCHQIKIYHEYSIISNHVLEVLYWIQQYMDVPTQRINLSGQKCIHSIHSILGDFQGLIKVASYFMNTSYFSYFENPSVISVLSVRALQDSFPFLYFCVDTLKRKEGDSIFQGQDNQSNMMIHDG